MKGKSIKKTVVKKAAVKKLNKVAMGRVKGGTSEKTLEL